MTARRTLAGTLAWRVVAVSVAGLMVVVAALLGSLALHLRAAAEQDLETAMGLLDKADAAGATLDQARIARVLPTGGIVALATADGSLHAIGPDSVDVAALPLDAEAGQAQRFTQGTRVYVGEVLTPRALTLSLGDDTDPVPVTAVLIALDVTSDRTTVLRVTAFAVAIALTGALALAAASRVVVRRSLRPLGEITAVATRIARTGAAEPLPEDRAFAETSALAEAVDDAIRRRTEAERAVRDFVADASHELRTPVAKIRGWSEVALESADPDRSRHALERAIAATDELATVIEELRLLAELDARPARATAPVDLADVAREVVEDARVSAPGADISLVADGPAMVHGDRSALRRAVRNLVGNALHHGAPPVQVRVTAASGRVTVEVSDRGKGVPRDERDRVFDRFYSTRAGDPRHSGLGLAIVAATARAHGGDARLSDDADSDSDSGTTFILTLPQDRPSR